MLPAGDFDASSLSLADLGRAEPTYTVVCRSRRTPPTRPGVGVRPAGSTRRFARRGGPPARATSPGSGRPPATAGRCAARKRRRTDLGVGDRTHGVLELNVIANSKINLTGPGRRRSLEDGSGQSVAGPLALSSLTDSLSLTGSITSLLTATTTERTSGRSALTRGMVRRLAWGPPTTKGHSR